MRSDFRFEGGPGGLKGVLGGFKGVILNIDVDRSDGIVCIIINLT